MLFFRGRDECFIPHPIYDDDYDSIADGMGMGEIKPEMIYPGLLPAEDYYDNMVTWK